MVASDPGLSDGRPRCTGATLHSGAILAALSARSASADASATYSASRR